MERARARPALAEDQGRQGDRHRARGLRLIVVKITTDQDGLYGYGCATFTQRADLVVPAVEKYLKPFLIGKPADRIDDIWQACYNSSYWRNGPVLNNAISGVDQALWDIKGRQAGMPVYQLLGGKCREAVDCYAHASGAEIPAGHRQRAAIHGAGLPPRARAGRRAGHGRLRRAAAAATTVPALHDAPGLRAGAYMRARAQAVRGVPQGARRRDRTAARRARARARPRRPCSSPRTWSSSSCSSSKTRSRRRTSATSGMIRQQCATPIAMGELFNSPHEWTPLIAERLIDYIRIHVSQAGGLTPCRKIAALGGDLRRAHRLARAGRRLARRPRRQRRARPGLLQLRHPGVGLQRRDARGLPGLPGVKNGYLYANEAPGWGIEVDEKAAAKYPFGTARPASASASTAAGARSGAGRHDHQAVGGRRHLVHEAPVFGVVALLLLPSPEDPGREDDRRNRCT